MMAAVAANPAVPEQSATATDSLYTPHAEFLRILEDDAGLKDSLVIRAQDPGLSEPLYSPGPVTDVPPVTTHQTYQPYQPLWNPGAPPLIQDPFLPPAYQAAPQGGFSTGLNGPQPYRFGWSTRADFTYITSESVSRDDGIGAPGQYGDFGQMGVDVGLEYTTPSIPGWLFSFTQELGYRGWSGPTGGYGLPASVYHIGWDLELATPNTQGYSVQLGFTPSLNSDFDGTLSNDAWNFDARGILFIHHSPEWMVALGAGYWDRVDDIIVPYAGVVWTPNNYWEWRVLFPESRVSYFLGMHDGFAKWLYLSFEYNVESYQVNRTPMDVREQIQLEDWRLLLGLRSDNGLVTLFIEGGWVFGRDVEFKRATPGFSISDGFIGRAGIRF